MSQILEIKQVLSALIGAALALLGQVIFRKIARASTGRSLCIAYWEELKAVKFHDLKGMSIFVGFSSQTFDSLFRELADSLPETLSRDLMRYHWKMKYLEEMTISFREGGEFHIPLNKKALPPDLWKEAKGLNEYLLKCLHHYSTRNLVSLLPPS